jgi:hypothetical protein
MGHGGRAPRARGEASFGAQVAAVRALLYLCLVGPAILGFGLRVLATGSAGPYRSLTTAASARWTPPARGEDGPNGVLSGERPVPVPVGAFLVVLGSLITCGSLALLQVRFIPLPAIGLVAALVAGILVHLGYPALWTVLLVALVAWRFGSWVRRETVRAKAAEALTGAGGPAPDVLAAEAQAARNARTEQELAAFRTLAADAWETEVAVTWQRLGFRLARQEDDATGRPYLVGVDPDNRVTCFYLHPAGRPLTWAEVVWCTRLARGRRALAGVIVTRELVTSRALHRLARRGAVQIQDPLDFAMFRHFLNAQSPETHVRFGGAYSFIIIEPHERCH